MKKIIFILLGVGIINDAIAQNTLDKVGLSAAVPATTAYSLRLLTSNYSGPAVQVRRSSDNFVLDIGFTAGDVLDTASLKGFIGSDDGYITIWYDQSGNGFDAIQTSPPNQPIIVNAGIIERRNNSPYITYAGSQWLNLPMGLDRGSYPNTTVNLVYQNTGLSGSQALWGCDDGGWDRFQLLQFDAAPGYAYGLSNGGGTVPNATNNTNRNVYTAIMDYPATNGTYVVVNGVVEPGFTESGTGSTGNIAIGAIGGYGGYPFTGNTSEFIVFTSSLSTIDRETLETNQGNYYNNPAPVITANPSGAAQKICVSGTPTDLGVTATGSGTLSYQWYSNAANSNAGGTLVVGATSSTYTPASTTIGIFYYYVVVSESPGSPVTSTVSGAIDVQASISATVAGNDPTCLANGSIVITNPQSAAYDYITADFSALPAGATLSGSATIVAGECILTPAQGSQDGYIAFPVVAAAPAVFVASFDYRVADGSGADGTSFNYGVLSPGGLYEFGIVSTGLVIRLIEYGGQRVEVNYNGSDIISVPFALMDINYRTCILTVSSSNEISLSIGGIDVFTSRALPGSYLTDDKSSWQFAFASRCGGANNKHSIKNLSIISETLRYSIDGFTWQVPTTFILPAGNYALEAKLGNATACPIANLANGTLVAPALPVASISGSNTGLDSVVLIASGGVSYLWSGGNSISTAQNTFTFSGNYIVTVTDADGCTNKDSTIVTINLIGLNKYGSISTDSASNVNENGAIGKSSKVDTYGKIRHGGSRDGLTAANAAPNAYEIKQNFPGSVDGLYWIKNASINGGIPFQIYADMTTDGGGWTLILCNASPNPGWSDAEAILRNESSPSINATYSILSWADYIKRSSSGFQYMMDAQTRRDNGGIWTANDNYSFVSTSNGNTNITLNTKFGPWNYSDDDIEARMPWYSPGSAGVITTSSDANNSWWGTLIASGGWDPAPWLGNSVGHPGIIWYWVR